jgi:hypothetical protein
MTSREKVYHAIDQERLHQDRKWGTVEQRPHTVAEWILIAEAELAEAKHAWAKECSDPKALEELLQVAAVIVAALEQYQMEAVIQDPTDMGSLLSRQRHYHLQAY